jgi:truncated hemoglobin YjbI
MDSNGADTLLVRMGGASAVIDAIEGLHDRMLADDSLTPFLEGIDAQVWTEKQYDFLGRMLEASEYDGPRLRRTHQRLVDAGLSDEHFDRTLAYLREALADAEVPRDCTDEVIAAFEATRADILCR